LHSLYNSLPRRCQHVVRQKGFITKYWTLSSFWRWEYSVCCVQVSLCLLPEVVRIRTHLWAHTVPFRNC
jgi:hypothetical protein